jgi:hypothetical protein
MIRKKVLGTFWQSGRGCAAPSVSIKCRTGTLSRFTAQVGARFPALQEACRANLRFEVSFCAAHVAAKMTD